MYSVLLKFLKAVMMAEYIIITDHNKVNGMMYSVFIYETIHF